MKIYQQGNKIYNIHTRVANFWDESIAKIKEWVLPLPPPKFIVGREKTIEEIRDTLESGKNILLINGLGGIGKTLIAREVYHRFSNKYNKLLWLNATRGLYDAFTADTLLHALRLTEKISDFQNENTSKKNIIDFVIQIIYTYGEFPSLMIIDNVNEVKSDSDERELHDYILEKVYALSSKWLVIFTSRNIIANCEVKEIDFLEIEDAILLFKEHYKRPCSNEKIEKLVYSVGKHTLTIEMIAKTAQFLDWEFEELEEKFASRGLSLTDNADFYLEHAGKSISHVNTLTYLKTIFSLSNLSELSRELLSFLAIFPQERIKKAVLIKLYCNNKDDEDIISRELKNLYLNGWLYFQHEDTAYTIHAVIAEVVKDKEGFNNEIEKFIPIINRLSDLINNNRISIGDDYNTLINISLSLINKFENTNNVDIHNLCIVTGHLCSVVSKFSLCTDLARKAEKILGSRKNKKKLSNLEKYQNEIMYLATYDLLSTSFTNLTLYKEAYEYQKKLADLFENEDINDKDLALIGLKIYERMGYILNRLETNKMEDAKKYAYKGLEIIKKFEIYETQETSNIYNLLKMVHQHFEEFDIAIGYGNKAIDICEKILGENHPNLPVSHNNITTTYLMMCDWKNALKHTNKAKYYCEKYPEINEPHLAQSYSNLGMLYEEKARQILYKAENGVKRSRNTNLHLLSCKNYEQKQKECNKIFEKVITYYKKALFIFNKLYLSDTTSVANIYKNIANTKGFLGKFEEVIKYSKLSLAIYENRLLLPHHLIGEAHMTIALGNRDLNKYEKALYHIEKSIKIYREVYRDDTNSHIKEGLKVKGDIERKMRKKTKRTF